MKTVKVSSANCWTIPEEDFPAYGMPVEQWKFLLRYAVLAPSSHNSQPWSFHISDEHLSLYADRSRACRVVDPCDRELTMSCGCALFHLKTALRHFGRLGEVELLPQSNEPDLLARVSLSNQGRTSIEEELLFFAIPRRRTNRQRFKEESVPEALLQALRLAAEAEGAWLHVIEGEETRCAVAGLISEGDRRQWGNKQFRLELSKWVHSNRSHCHDGIPGYSQGVDDLMSYAGPLLVRTFDMGAGQAANNHELATGSPALAVLGTRGGTRRDWLACGQALARVLLRARVEDLWASFLNQPIEIPDLRNKVRELIGCGGFPQAILRLGFGEDIKPTPRREIENVLV